MSKRKQQTVTVTLDKIVGGGQALGTREDGQKVFVWNALPGETVVAAITKKKSKYLEAIATTIENPSKDRMEPLDPTSYLSTSPWQMMNFDAEQHYKAALVEEAFELHDIVLPDIIDIYTDNHTAHYRNKVEFSWYGDTDEKGNETLDLAFFRRGSKGKIIIEQCSLLPDSMMHLAKQIRDMLYNKHVSGRSLKTLIIRCNQAGECVWQLYIKDKNAVRFTKQEANTLAAIGGEIIYSDPKSPASRITKRLQYFGSTILTDTVLDVPFRYATESFFQINIPTYEQALLDMKKYIPGNTPVIDLYSGVGSIGLTIGGDTVTLVEINEDAVREMNQNIIALSKASTAKAILAPSEKALKYIDSKATIIVDPPRAGLHTDVIETLLAKAPKRIIYLSCNPTTQARDVALLAKKYGIRAHQGYNFFPRTPHIEHLAVLDLKN